MRINEILTEQELEELNWRKGLATAAMAAGALGAMGAANARVVPGQDSPEINRLTGQPNTVQMAPQDNTDRAMPNQNLDTVEKVQRSADGIKIQHGGETYNAVEVPKDSPTPRGAQKLKVHQAQMGIRGIGNYTVYLLPNGKAYIYSK